MERIEKTGAKIFRTDVNESSFWLTSNGNDIDIKEHNVLCRSEAVGIWRMFYNMA